MRRFILTLCLAGLAGLLQADTVTPRESRSFTDTTDRVDPFYRYVTFQLGEVFYAGDLLDSTGVFRFSDFNGLGFGVLGGMNVSDHFGWEGWGNLQVASRSARTTTGATAEVDLFRLDLSANPKIQWPIAMGKKANTFLIPQFGLGPVLTILNVSPRTPAATTPSGPTSASGLGIGASFDGGADYQAGNLLVGGKLRYILSYDLGSQLGSKNLGGMMLQLSAGWIW